MKELIIEFICLLFSSFVLSYVDAQDCSAQLAPLQANLASVQSSLDGIKKGVKVAAIVVPILGGLLLIVLVLVIVILVRVVRKIVKKLPLPAGWGFIRFIRNIDKLKITLGEEVPGVQTDIKLEAEVNSKDDDKKKKKGKEEELDEEEKRRVRRRIAYKREDDEGEKKRVKEDYEKKTSKLRLEFSAKGAKEIRFPELGSLSFMARGVLHTTYRGEYQGHSIVFRKYPFPDLEDEDKKRSKEEKSNDEIEEYLEEDSYRRRLTHKHIVEHVGICIDWPNFGFMTRHYSQGSLYENYIKEKTIKLSAKQLARIAVEIASAVKYCHENRAVVRVVASRNVMLDQVDGEYQARLDISFEPSTMTGFYYGKQRAYVGPVSWLSPESMESKKFTTESDCFSFGVFLWEIMAQSDPFPERTTIEVACPVIHKGLRLKIPADTPASVKGLIEKCFEVEPKSRPNIDEIHNTLVEYHKSL